MTLLVLFLILWPVDADQRVELYRKGDETWTCTDTGSYLRICGERDFPNTVACKEWKTGKGQTLWECGPAQREGWELKHIHTCITRVDDNKCWEQCSLHTFANPRHEVPPIIILIGVFFILLIMSCSQASDSDSSYDGAFWGAYMGSSFGSESDDWHGSSWS